ncbi:gp53-like domain-containing protein [Acinetobacter pollinis]|uniref:gp53-like domain-containing protein n=1 Tax=Acinetobacter pollinis TaxID=2605270 RepID=UPI0018C310DD|nr:hypothetical protein [Acinetobacter pollinis]MBF7694169.1 hypothetical protein [Acinetobacter pollinis]MBF7701756.1 hypothetical protein [Acinetobacter pollinis]
MAKQIVNIGANANDGSGDAARSAFSKLNQNDSELYSQLGADANGNLPSALPVSKGGTGAQDIDTARTNLGLSSSLESTLAISKNGDLISISSSIVVNTNSSGVATVSFPKAFPNVCVVVIACVGNPDGGTLRINDPTWTPTSFQIKGSPNIGLRVNYIAQGK